MLISYKWLKDFVDIDKTPAEIAELITMHSFEVESLTELGKGLEKVVVGQVLSVAKHPDADKLSVTRVKVAQGEELDIVCGAPNVAMGQKVAVALVGASLPSGMRIEERKVRGEKSCGMICAEDELGLGKDHAGIMVLDDALIVGTPLVAALDLDDAIIDINILPNRAHDCLCHYGVAREVAALTGKPLKRLKAGGPVEPRDKNESLEVEVRDKDLCLRYTAALVEGVEVKESPENIRKKLQSVGLRPVNNIVDITNFIMFAYGQPLHAFDADKIRGKIVVRRAAAGERLLALDDKEYELTENDLVIADAQKPIAIAGVIGGKASAVSASTKRVVFESANFYAVGIRKTAQRLKAFTDASYRFERSIDPELTAPALRQALEMAAVAAGGKVGGPLLDIYPAPRAPRSIEFAYERVRQLLGIEIPAEKALSILGSLELEATLENGRLKVAVPSFRLDIEKANDVIEEIGRINGYLNVPVIPAEVEMREVRQDALWQLERRIREIWKGLGFFEECNYSLLSEKDIKDFCLAGEHVELKNYLSEEHKLFRTSMIPRLIKSAEENLKHRDEIRIFESGHVAFPMKGQLPMEKRHLGGVFVPAAADDKLFYAGKGMLESFLESLGIPGASFRTLEGDKAFWHQGRSAEILVKDRLLGRLGEVHPQVLQKAGVGQRAFAFEIDEEELAECLPEADKFREINRLPQSEFDLAVVVDEGTEWQAIADSVAGLGDASIRSVRPFDVYAGENIASGKKSIAFRVVCQAADKTLSDEEIKATRERIVGALAALGAEIRQ